MKEAISILTSEKRVKQAKILSTQDIIVEDWVRTACNKCSFMGKSWSCPPSVPGITECRKKIKSYKRTALVVFGSSKKPKELERIILSLEKDLVSGGYPRAKAFFISPCSECPECKYPVSCPTPDKCRPTGESFGVDLLGTAKKAGIEIKKARKGEEFTPLTLFLLD